MRNIRSFDFDKDFDYVTAIDTKSFEEYWTLEDFKKRLKQKSITCLIVEEKGEVVGFLMYEIYLQRFTILRIGVLPNYRKQGIGSALLKALTNKLTEKRRLISTEVRETNLSVQLFLKSQNHKAVEILKNYYPDTEEDAFVFHYRAEAKTDS